MYQLIVFDLGGVVFTNGTRRFIKALTQRYSLDQSKVKQVLDGSIGYDYRRGVLGRDEFWDKVIGRLKLTENSEKLEQEWISYYELIEDTKDLILKLKAKYQVWYLSNNVKERAKALDKRFGFTKWFDGGIFSHEVGMIKPNPDIYRLLLKKAQVEPQKAVFIDDKESSLKPAITLGITPVLFTGPENLEVKLTRLKIL